ncbi:MAG: hypothetical protein ABW118_05815 [Candidatus Thiodiazotropha sp.]
MDYEWKLDECLEKLCPRLPDQLCDSFAKVSGHRFQAADVTDEMLEESYITIAKIVKTYGEDYLPIFERLHEERKSRQTKKALLDEALKISDVTPTP